MSELFDRYKSSYGEVVEGSIRFSGLQHDFFLRAKAELLRRLAVEQRLRQGGAQVRALDVGCGVGSLHPYLEDAFDRLDGCDVSKESLSRASGTNPHVAYRACTPSRLPYEDGTFDLAFASCVVHHVPPASWRDFFRELRRVLRGGGLACIIEHNPYNPLTRMAVLRCPFDKDAVLLSAGKTASLLRQAGFSDIGCQHFLLLPSARPLARRLERAFAGLPLGAQYACSGHA
ncbi:methyltransferase domain-containing protein [Mesorhizobium sp. VK23B]|uniref:Methyltransferase domain-containing protein n=1 Tax=Mesorhizobium dulcispinae TaxID=3072316 RepID=A0ABU4XCS1_9HYPH|nr:MULTISPECIES: methyltransferase domain-containing protein [unclassified Mesorhizobium]MDX8466007.1 methyltransferase domain-containing protein [Mesorhizobium sp. VK23B]MDX8471818.1 methyltransferase domain-containing protein [Mesorhizobium sp. VK23A]MDX8520758.1 methyltransferase domain-containing protein [Mesorhizobium sp. VK23D]